MLACGPSLYAHEIGTTRVSAVFDEGRYDIDIVTDAPSLIEKLDALAGSDAPPVSPADADAAVLAGRLVARDDVFRRRVTVAFDGATSHPEIRYTVSRPPDETKPILATIRLTGAIPHGARQFTWAYAWTFASYPLSVKDASTAARAAEWLEGGQASAPFAFTTPPPPPSRWATAWRYLTLGFTHIVPRGLDHMLFVIGIFLLRGRLRSVLAQVSAFTVAHSITLGLSIYGVIAVPPSIVEPLIAVSIAYVAIENLLRNDVSPWRIALVFAFGLLHGMGFAGVLGEIGLPRSEFLTALLTFNLGVEAGQLAVIVAAFALVGWQWSHLVWYRRRIVVPVSVVIACTAVYWTVERVAF
jgi:hydrogenase/urease accessory protein HupE